MKPIRKTPKTFLGLGIILLLIIETIILFFSDYIVSHTTEVFNLEFIFYSIVIGGPLLMFIVFGGWRYINKCHQSKVFFNLKFFNLVVFPSLAYVLLGFQFYHHINLWIVLPLLLLCIILFIGTNLEKCPYCYKPLIDYSSKGPSNYGHYNYSVFHHKRCMWCGLSLRASYYENLNRDLEQIREDVKNGKYNRPMVTYDKNKTHKEALAKLIEQFGGEDKLLEHLKTLPDDEKRKLLKL